MSKIEILSDDLINKIAAGEVIERPASAVKELVENSIDANSKKIDIYIKNAGKSEITVSDNGSGIEKSQLKKAVIRHSTSKINSNLLNKIKTMGFRGEALSSICHVAKLTITSKTANDDAFAISAYKDQLSDTELTTHPNGTSNGIVAIMVSIPQLLKEKIHGT